MEPHIIDYYNEMPYSVNVIDKMNTELSELQDKYNELDKEYKQYKKTHIDETFIIPKIRIHDFNEFKKYANKIYNSVENFKKIIYDFLNHEGWILNYDRPHGMPMLLHDERIGYWIRVEREELSWDEGTSAQEYWGYDDGLMTEYCLYLKCKILSEIYKLFPEYKNRNYGWFHKIIDESFDEINKVYVFIMDKIEAHDIIYKIIMKNIFGWDEDVFPMEYENEDFIQNIIYYKCERCKKITYGENFMDPRSEDFNFWYSENGEYCEKKCYCDYLSKFYYKYKK